jgi:16S rRNA (uracil1498-N3)-methyltransferase
VRLTRVHAGVPLAAGRETDLGPEAAHHVTQVLRLRVGDPLVVFDGAGAEFDAGIVAATRRHVRVSVFGRRDALAESPLRITLLQAVSRSDRMDLTLQKATELGVHGIVPLLAARSVVRLDGDHAGRKLEHWRAILVNACEQCGRATLPTLHPPERLAQWLLQPAGGARRLLLDPSGVPLQRSGRAADVEILVGPEGGFEPDEVERAIAAGFVATQLGPRILRTETAAIAAIAVLQALDGDLA